MFCPTNLVQSVSYLNDINYNPTMIGFGKYGYNFFTARVCMCVWMGIRSNPGGKKQSHYRSGQALRGSRRLRFPDFKTIDT